MRHAMIGLGALAATAFTNPALAEGKPLPPASSDTTVQGELTITMEGDKPVCAPAELRLPSNTNVALHIVNTANVAVTITAPGQFEKGHVLHADGSLIHVASEKGYLMKANGQGTLKIRTLMEGTETYACTTTGNRMAPFEGKLVLTPPAG